MVRLDNSSASAATHTAKNHRQTQSREWTTQRQWGARVSLCVSASTFRRIILVTFLDRPYRSKHSVLMKVFRDRSREMAGAFAISHAEVARRAGLSDRRFSHYVTGRTEPDLARLVSIAIAMEMSPDALLGVRRPHPST